MRAHAPAPLVQKVEVVVALSHPPLAAAVGGSRELAGAVRRGRLDLRAPASVAYVRRLAVAQRALQGRIAAELPSARFRWRYRIVANGIAVVLPADQVQRLTSIPGVSRVYPSVRYRAQLNQTPGAIKATSLWGPGLATAGNGIKIGILDDGIDHRHPFFRPDGFTPLPGFPRGQRAYTTAKVIVARVFKPPPPSSRYAGLAFDPRHSEHGTHVAGIAAGNHNTTATIDGRSVKVSGVAPKAYLGSYRVLTIPTASGVGLDGNSPEIVAGIEAAVRDGMDVINLSLGESEIEPSRDLVVRAIDAAAEAGVVPVVAAGNNFADFGRGSITSPGSAARALTVAAATSSGGQIAEFSSAGPTPFSLRLKPDVTAPGIGVLSSFPARRGTWAGLSGTSMAAPHAAGAAALLRQRHPAWTVAQVKSALVLTGAPVDFSATAESAATRQGGGLIDLVRADRPLVFADPTGVSFGLMRPQTGVSRRIELADAGDGAGTWAVSVATRGASVSAPATATVPGQLTVTAKVGLGAPERDIAGFIVLKRGGETRRIPFWLRATAPRLRWHRARALPRTGTYRGNTRGRPALVTTYRYPDNPSGLEVRGALTGPEQVFRVRLRRPAANFGVAVIEHARGVAVEPRILLAQDENRLAGETALPVNLNPYLPTFRQREPVSAVLLPDRGVYYIVFDGPSRARAGRFRFRFWIDDRTPPRVRLLTPVVEREGVLRLSATDHESGVSRLALFATIDGREWPLRYSRRSGLIVIDMYELARGRHRLVLQASDRQEVKNTENVPRVLPNTRTLRATFVVR